MKKLAYLLPLLLITACGGGGDNTPAAVVSPPAQPPSPPSPPPADLVFSIPSTTAATVTAIGSAGTVAVTLSHQGNLSGQIYATAADPAKILQAAVSVTANKDNTHTLSVSTLPTVAAGHYSGNLTLNVCNDAACANPVKGSPFQVPYDVSIIPEWQTFQANAAHTGYVPLTLNPAAFKARWTWKSPQNSYYYTAQSAAVTGNGLVYFNIASQVLALKEADGTQAWNMDFSSLSAYPNAPAASDGKLYLMANQNNSSNLYVLDATSGAILSKSGGASSTQGFIAPTVASGIVYSGWSGNGLAAFDGISAAQKYFTVLQASDMWTPAVDANNVYTYTSGTSIYVNGNYVSSPPQFTVLDRTTGAVKAAVADPYSVTNAYYPISLRSAPVLGAAGSAFTISASMNSNGGNLNNINLTAGKWNWTVTGRYAGNPAYANGVIYAANTLPLQLEARSETNGKLLWSWTPLSTSESGFVGDVLLTDSHVFISTNVNTYAIDLNTHQYAWIYPSSGKLSLSANGVLYILTPDSKLAAIALK